MQASPATTQTFNHCLSAVMSLACLCFITSCSSHSPGGTITVAQTAGYQPNHGPFDSNGNYVDAWADNPPRRRYVSREGKVTSPPPPVAYTPPPKASAKPKSTPKPKPKATTRSHTVKRGDTLYGLSRKYGVSVSSIQRANKLRNTTIRLGQRLTIPR